MQIVVERVAQLEDTGREAVGEAALDLAAPDLDHVDQPALLRLREPHRPRGADGLELLDDLGL